ncbi:helix-turn-helix domain-containing protein [Nonomuraea soli]|uniref:Transcriptional regulator with XRE-family HTH domain n=1 Tax=Nonomuraea soli TaxID=1032476 RepID=A0A7W0HW08_9ACTN|nr:helix-turn-helix domain-containing protein [Nonomuraea soli]MBA2897715.1 transcriptional regulator with XRE-family HTH domain [Nonomuraea soli]
MPADRRAVEESERQQVHEHLGRALREARTAQGISLRALAADIGISASLLSQVENGKSQPSVSTLYALVSRLRVSLDDLLGLGGPPPPGVRGTEQAAGSLRRPDFVLQRADDTPALVMDSGVRWERLASIEDGLVDSLLVIYPPGAASSADGTLMRHSGFEYGYLLTGSLTLVLEFDRYHLRAGDSFCFESSRPHLYVNHGEEATRGLWHVVGRDAAPQTPERFADLLGHEPIGE